MKVLFILISVCSFLLDQGVSDAGSDGVSVKEGDPVTLHTDVKINHRDIMMWYFNTIRIAYINGVQKICTDKQCPERFRDGLKLDNQTGSLTITNTRITDSGEYKLVGGSNSGKIFNVIVTGVFGDTDEVKSVMEGDRVTLNPGVTKESDMVRWYFNSILIAMIDGKSCSYDGEGGRFRDRLKEDHETRSLTITNITTQHAGHYEAEVFSESSGKNEHLNRPSSCDSTKIIPKSSNLGEIIKSISLTVSVSKADKNEEEPQKAPQDQNIDASSGLSSASVAGIVGAVLLVTVIAGVGVINYRHRKYRNDKKKNNQGLLQKV